MTECYNDAVMQEDIESIVRGRDFSFLREARVLVTGATGLLGSHLVRTLAAANRLRNTGMTLYLQIRNREKAERIFGREFLERKDIRLIQQNVRDPWNLPEPADYVFHAASPTSSRYFVSHPAETIMDAVAGTDNLLKACRNAKGIIYFSSLEVYGVAEETVVNENSYGYIDFLNVRSSYSESKRLCETLCRSYWQEYGVPVKIVRLSQTFGTGVEYDDGRVFAEFIRCAMEKRDIILHTAGNTLRSYLYTKDAVTGILSVLEKGNPGEAYNLSNPETAVSIREMAETVKNTFPEAGIEVRIEIPEDASKFGYNPEMKIILDITKARSLGWKPETGLREMFVKLRDSICQRYPQRSGQ